MVLNFKKLIFSALLAMTSAFAFAQPDPNFHIYLCFGQSNMEGNASPEAIDRNNVPERFQMMAAVNFSNPSRKMYNWYKATPPLVRQGTGLTPVDWFGRTMCSNLPEEVKVGVIVVAIGGCKIEHLDKDFNPASIANEADWFKNYMAAYDNHPYQRLLECAKKAQEVGVIKGMLLHQGCSNNGDQQWPAKVKKIYNDLLNDLNLQASDVPILAGELVSKEMGGVCWGHNSIIQTLPKTIPTAHVISSANCPQKGDGLHFTAHGYRVMGCRYATKMLRLMGISPVVEYEEEEPLTITTTPRDGDYVFDFKTMTVSHGTGKFGANRGNLFIPGPDCFCGWEYLDESLDLSGYKYLVAEIADKQTVELRLKVWDTPDYEDVPYSRFFGESTAVVCELDGMMKNLPTGIESLNTQHVYRVGLWANGNNSDRVKLKHIFATNYDPYNPDIVTGIIDANAGNPSDGNVYNLQGVKVADSAKDNNLQQGLYVINGKKFLVK